MAKDLSSETIDIKGLLSGYMAKWYYFAISIAVCVALAFLYGKVKKPEYEVRANVLIAQENSNPLANVGGLSGLFGSNGNVDDEVFILTSHSLYRDVVKQLGANVTHIEKKGFLNKVFAYPEFPLDIKVPAGMYDTLTVGINAKIKVNEEGLATAKFKVKRDVIGEVKNAPLPVTVETAYGDFTIVKTKSYPAGEEVNTTISMSGYDAAAEDLAQEITYDIPNRHTNVILLSMTTINPAFGMDVFNSILKKYNERGMEDRTLQSEKDAEFLDGRLSLLAQDLNETEATIQQYKQKNNIVDVKAEAAYQTTKKGQLEAALLEAETRLEILGVTRDFISDPNNAYNLIPASPDNSSLQSAIASYNDVVLRRMGLMNNAKANNAALRQITEQLDAMRANLNTSVDKVYQSAQIKVRDLRAEMGSTQSSLGKIPAQEREYLNMQRQQSVKQQLYLYLLQRREETAMILANSVPKGIIVDEAYTLNEPVGMGRLAILVIGLFIGLIIPPLIIYIQKLLRNKFETREEVEQLTNVPIIGEMCVDRSGQSLVVSPTSTSSSAELFRLIRSNVTFVLNNPNDKVVLVTSSSSGEGKSFISINLAASFALLGKKVLLVGMDIRKPRLSQYLKIHPKFGLTQYLSSGEVTISDIINKEPMTKNLDVIVAGPVPPNPGELLTSEKVDELFHQLRGMYDYVIVDTAPIGMVSDTFTLNRLADATIFVTRVASTSISDIKFLNDIYRQARLKKLSLIINGVASKKSYGYGNKSKGSSGESHK